MGKHGAGAGADAGQVGDADAADTRRERFETGAHFGDHPTADGAVGDQRLSPAFGQGRDEGGLSDQARRARW